MTVASGGAISFACVVSGGGGGGGDLCPSTLPSYPNATTSCDASTGVISTVCMPGSADANGDLTDGCEQSLAVELCNGIDDDGNGLVDEGFALGPVPNGQSVCSPDGSGTVLVCNAGWIDANSSPLDGCETPAGTSGAPVINEVDYDEPGIDTADFVEIYNPTDSAQAFIVAAVDGTLGYAYAQILTQPVPAHGYLPVPIQLQNGPDGILLIDPSTDELLDSLAYEGPVAPVALSGIPGIYAVGEGTPAAGDPGVVDGSLIRSPDGRDTNDNSADFLFTTTPTPGAPNVLTP